MRNATYRLGKHRVYACVCGGKPHRPLRAADTIARPFPKPCDRCGRSLAGKPFAIEDDGVWIQEAMDKAREREEPNP